MNDCSLEFSLSPSKLHWFWEAIVGQRRSIRRFDSMDVIVILLFFDLPLKPASVQREYCWTMPPHGRLTQQVLLTRSSLILVLPLKPADGLRKNC